MVQQIQIIQNALSKENMFIKFWFVEKKIQNYFKI